ncbi:hypothetical protein [Lignipirellula cremea]|uniref:J domain-containing protein n=1 Tax=Lignipirellula cremea TaxID=2528010 RepID=A0A518DRK1_9BACT|nr:hypothetical protein [Lignipirellula cremea]QDU94459.1 hypothetical protein Pla8534_22500 [Lignipirellula cremea]
MADKFDPYREWLGIPPSDQPLDYYRLLGLEPSERDPQRIAAAAERRIQHVRTCAVGPHARDAEAILNELASAQLCLLDPQARAAYDHSLALGGAASPASPSSPSVSNEVQHFAEMRAAMRRAPGTDPAAASTAPYPGGAPLGNLQGGPAATPGEEPEVDEAAATPFWRSPLAIGAGAGLALVLLGGIVWFARSDSSPPAPASTEVAAPVVETPVPANLPPTPSIPLATAGAGGVITLRPDQAELTGGLLVTSQGGEPVIGNWSSFDSVATWRVEVKTSSYYTVRVLHSARDKGSFTVSNGESERKRSVRVKGDGQFNIDEFVLRLPKKSEYLLTVKAAEMSGAELMELKSIELTPSKRR